MTDTAHETQGDIDATPSEELPAVELQLLTEEHLARRIFVMRGTKVMLDADLAARTVWRRHESVQPGRPTQHRAIPTRFPIRTH